MKKTAALAVVLAFVASGVPVPLSVCADDTVLLPSADPAVPKEPGVSLQQAQAGMQQDAADLKQRQAMAIAVMQPAEQPQVQTLQFIDNGKPPEVVLLADKEKKVTVTTIDGDGNPTVTHPSKPPPPPAALPPPPAGGAVNANGVMTLLNIWINWIINNATNVVVNPGYTSYEIIVNGQSLGQVQVFQSGQINATFYNGVSVTISPYVGQNGQTYYNWQVNYPPGWGTYYNGQFYGVSTVYYNSQNNYMYYTPSNPGLAGSGSFYLDPNDPTALKWYPYPQQGR